MKFSVIKNNSEAAGVITMEEYVSQIKTQSRLVDEYRSLLLVDPEKAGSIKKSMPGITPGGIFKEKRVKEALVDYSGIICVDIDNLSKQSLDIYQIKANLAKDKYGLLVHLSMSGNGLAVFVKVDSGAEMHSDAYRQVSHYLEYKYNIKVDPSCKDVSRQRYLSHDEDAVFNLKAKVFHILDHNVYEMILDQVDFTKQIKSPEPGSRNNFIFQLACNCAGGNIDIESLMAFCVRYIEPDFTVSEIKTAVESAYKRLDSQIVVLDSEVQIGQSAQSALSAPSQESSLNYDQFEDSIFPKLPLFLQGYDLITSTKIQRDIVLITNLGILSSSLPNVFVIHSGSRTYPNLYFLIYAPPASDKGIMGLILKSADSLDKTISDEKLKEFLELAGGGDDEPPTFKGLYLDADSSSIAMIQSLAKGQENLLSDTEAVILSNNRKNDWAQLDPHLRKAYHFERISVSRKDKIITIRDPRLSILISGTTADAKVFSGSIQGGLTSRILPYSFSAPMIWQNQFSDESSRIPEFIAGKSKDLIDIYLFHKENPFELKFTAEQKQRHFEIFGEWTEELDNGDEFAFLKRLGGATVRLAMILTALKKFEQQNRDSVVECDDEMFNIALSITNTFRNQGTNFYKLISENKPVGNPRLSMVMDSLQKQFTTQQFVLQCKQMIHINRRQAMKHLDSLMKTGFLVHIKQGVYEKV